MLAKMSIKKSAENRQKKKPAEAGFLASTQITDDRKYAESYRPG